jgi:hypothetical protein
MYFLYVHVYTQDEGIVFCSMGFFIGFLGLLLGSLGILLS